MMHFSLEKRSRVHPFPTTGSGCDIILISVSNIISTTPKNRSSPFYLFKAFEHSNFGFVSDFGIRISCLTPFKSRTIKEAKSPLDF